MRGGSDGNPMWCFFLIPHKSTPVVAKGQNICLVFHKACFLVIRKSRAGGQQEEKLS